uniref:Ice-binding protein C-terminal domain-containing protein n=1 Tax=Geobacter sp. (strain M21) TaxID=443144 RepID=C6DZU9_GEOSM
MKKTRIVLLLLSSLLMASPAPATMINVGAFSGSFDNSSYGHVHNLTFDLGMDNPERLFFDDQFGQFVKMTPSNASNDLVAMLEGRFVPLTTVGDMPDAEKANMWLRKMLHFYLVLTCEEAGYSQIYHQSPIPDLSMYKIESLYMYNSILSDGAETGFDLQLYADAKAVPEPSTLLLFMAGLAATICFLLRGKVQFQKPARKI